MTLSVPVCRQKWEFYQSGRCADRGGFGIEASFDLFYRVI